MKKILTYLFASFFVFAFSTISIPDVVAMTANTYKTVTNENIIYIVEDERGNFLHSWQFDKEKYRDDIHFDLDIDYKSKIYDKYKNYLFDIKTKQLSFKYHGDLPSTATIKVNVEDKFADGEKLYLYYFNEETNKLEFIDDNLIVKNGFAEFKIDHCSDYILTASIVKSAIDNPDSLGTVIIVLLVIGVILVAVTLFMNSGK
ncbi:MAG TPA: hypothetical protein GXZ95_04245 [Mollicutes bacterium]|nr:hypothetical protein [Mollicutes bacterium]